MSGHIQKYSIPGIRYQVIRRLGIVLLGAMIVCNTNLSLAAQQKSHRIEVYALTENYWDTKPGDTLGGIVARLLPNNPAKRETLKQDILRLNPKRCAGADNQLFATAHGNRGEAIALA